MKIDNATAKCSQITIDREDLLIINAALNEVCNGMPMFEFETRIGFNRERVLTLLKNIGFVLDKMDV
jgi:hypothetical protein